MMKKLLKLVAALVLLVVVAVIALVFYLDSAVRVAVERGGTHALGVETTLDSANLRPLRGSCTISGLNVANPDGYRTERFLGLEGGHVAVTLSSIREDTIEVPVITLDGLEINLEKRDGKANYEVILDNMKREETGGPTEEESAGKTYVIRELVITNLIATVDLLPESGELSRITIPVDEIRLENVGSAGEPVTTSELVSIVIKTIFATLGANPLLPDEIARGINQRMAGLQEIRAQGESIKRDVDATKKALDDAGKSIDDAAKRLGDVFGGKKD